MQQGQRWGRWNATDLERKPQLGIIVRLIGYGWRYKSQMVVAFLAMTGASLLALVIPMVLGSAIDQAYATGVRREFFLLSGTILVVSALRAVFAYGQNYFAEAVSQRTAFDLRSEFFRKLQSLSFGFHDKQHTGNLMSKATADVEAVRTLMSMGLLRGISTVITLILITTIMLSLNWRLGLVCISFVPIILWRVFYMSRKLRYTWMQVQTETGNMTTVLQENIVGARVVKSFGANELEERKFEERASKVAKETYFATRLFASQGSLMTFIFTVATGAILWFGGREVIADRLSVGELATFILYMGMLMMPVRMIGFLINIMSRASSAGERIFDVLDAKSPVEDRADAKTLPTLRGDVKFEHVSLRYDELEEISALTDINFEAKATQTIAFLGASGSGKSSVVHLIPRFYDVTEGRITVDGIDVRDATLQSLRKNIGIVMQDVFVFGATIRDNISYGTDAASITEVVKASKIAQFDEFVQGLPKGYDTWVGERGVTLSGGQKQRLAIARTLLLDPPILILDDSTSSVDMGTEYMIQQALVDVMHDRTTFVIAHRVSTVRNADLVIVLDKGQIVESGSHVELMEMDGLYRRIHDLQLMPQDNPVPVVCDEAGGDS